MPPRNSDGSTQSNCNKPMDSEREEWQFPWINNVRIAHPDDGNGRSSLSRPESSPWESLRASLLSGAPGSSLKRTSFASSFLATADRDFREMGFPWGDRQLSQTASCPRGLSALKDHFTNLAVSFHHADVKGNLSKTFKKQISLISSSSVCQ